MRDAQTPLLLWICAAVCAHYMFAEGGVVVARNHEDKSALLKLVRQARDRVRFTEQTFEVSSLDEGKKADEAAPSEPPPPPPPPPQPKPQPTTKIETPKPPAPAPPKAKPPEEKKKPVVAVVEEEKKQQPPPPDLLADKRIAVKQHAKKDQQDNPKARFLADEANHVEQETVATQTSHDQDDKNPTPGGNHAGPRDKVGDSERTKIAESENHAGEKDRAPGEKGTEFQVQKDPPPLKPQAAIAVEGPKAPAPPQSGGDGKPAQAAENAPTPPQLAPGGAAPGAPDISTAPGGTWSFNPIRPGTGQGAAKEQGPGQAIAQKNPSGKPSVQWLGLGGQAGPGQVNLNLSHTGVVATVGLDQLRKEREADGERRRSEHRGSWTASGFERWRSAIENYVSSVKPGNQTALNTAQSPFATYLTMMHNRIHPIFADSFLGSLDNLPKTHPLNDTKLLTTLEIVLTKDGKLTKMGIVRTSGVTAFDIAALDSVQRASPFGPAPSAIVSTDGNVYLHWQFHRDEVFACSTMNARPYLLNVPAPAQPVDPEPGQPPPPPSPSRERGVPANTQDTREGLLRPRVPRPVHTWTG